MCENDVCIYINQWDWVWVCELRSVKGVRMAFCLIDPYLQDYTLPIETISCHLCTNVSFGATSLWWHCILLDLTLMRQWFSHHGPSNFWPPSTPYDILSVHILPWNLLSADEHQANSNCKPLSGSLMTLWKYFAFISIVLPLIYCIPNSLPFYSLLLYVCSLLIHSLSLVLLEIPRLFFIHLILSEGLQLGISIFRTQISEW